MKYLINVTSFMELPKSKWDIELSDLRGHVEQTRSSYGERQGDS